MFEKSVINIAKAFFKHALQAGMNEVNYVYMEL